MSKSKIQHLHYMQYLKDKKRQEWRRSNCNSQDTTQPDTNSNENGKN